MAKLQLLVECRYLDKVRVINEGTKANKKVKVQGVFQRADEQNNNGRVYPKKVLEGQVKALQSKITERSLVGALDHPTNDAIHLSQASHLITKLWMEGNDVMGEAEILSTPNGKIVDALLHDEVKIGISSRGLGTVSESTVNEDFRLLTFDLVSDPSTRGASPSVMESMNEATNSAKAQKIKSDVRSQQIFLTALNAKLDEVLHEEAGEDDDYGNIPKLKVKGKKGKNKKLKRSETDAGNEEDRKEKTKMIFKYSENDTLNRLGQILARKGSNLQNQDK
tara:strand:- start:1147 stop:1983 length:837 start_codon:yes stop_codon:yes gene_type:complete